MKKYFYSLLLLLLAGYCRAQDSLSGEGPQTGMRSDGKIYVVVAVVLTILAGLIIYLIRIDRKISKLEKKNP
jgi:hypothetical protein